jgi:activator of HSP90 ATPase
MSFTTKGRIMKAQSFTISASFPCSSEAVFTALTNARQISAWSGQGGKVQPTIGGTLELFDGWVKGKVLAYESGKRLSFTWRPSEWAKDQQASIVTCLFKSTKTGTKLTLKHSGFPNDSELQSHKAGWKEFVFEPLKMYLVSTQK